MSWTAVILKGPDAEPLIIEDINDEKPREWMVWSYGDQQEGRMGFYRIGVCEETQTAYLLKVLQWEEGKLTLNVLHIGDKQVQSVFELGNIAIVDAEAAMVKR